MNAPLPQAVTKPQLMLAPLDWLVPSSTHVQQLRRSRFTDDELEEMAASIRANGLAQAPLVRPIPGDSAARYEIVAGERRYLGAKLAGLTEIYVLCRELADDQVLELQLIENLQRKGLQPLEEAEGYRELMGLKQINATAMGVLIGKSRSYVYARTKLLDLCPEARTAMQDGTLDGSKGLLLARIPGPKLQQKALKILQAEGTYYSFRRLMEKLRDTFTVRLDKAPFALDNEHLSAGAEMKVIRDVQPHPGTCTGCPHNSANDPELQAELDLPDGAHVCMHSPCYEYKVKVHWEHAVIDARNQGRTVLTGDEARKAIPSRYQGYNSEWLDLDAECEEAEHLLGEDDPLPHYRDFLKDAGLTLTLAQDPDGQLRRLVSVKDATKALKAQKIELAAHILQPIASHEETPSTTDPEAERLAEEKEQLRRAIETEWRKRLFVAIVGKWKGPLKRSEFAVIAHQLEDGGAGGELLHEAFGGKVPNVEKCSDADAMRLVFALLFSEDQFYENHGKPGQLLDYAGRLKIDAKKLKATVAAELTPKVEKAAKGKRK